ncbi:MAG: SH3 domain-containing protein [bacterium]|nr:SH3 domain-containing protein [bacterium]
MKLMLWLLVIFFTPPLFGQEIPEVDELIVLRNDSLVRAEPRQKAKAIARLARGTILRKIKVGPAESLKIGGRERTAPWIRVKGPDISGWIFGELVSNYVRLESRAVFADGLIVHFKGPKRKRIMDLSGFAEKAGLDQCGERSHHIQLRHSDSKFVAFGIVSHAALFPLDNFDHRGDCNSLLFSLRLDSGRVKFGGLSNTYAGTRNGSHLFYDDVLTDSLRSYSLMDVDSGLFRKMSCYPTGDQADIVKDFLSSSKFDCHMRTPQADRETEQKEIRDNCRHRSMGWFYVQKANWTEGRFQMTDDLSWICANNCVADCTPYRLR